MGRKKVPDVTIKCKCGCGMTKIVKRSNPKGKFIDRTHYAKWLKANPPDWLGGNATSDLGPKIKRERKKTEPPIPTGKFPLFL